MRALKQKWGRLRPTALTVALITCIPFGILMSWIMDNSDWLMFCATLFLFWS